MEPGAQYEQALRLGRGVVVAAGAPAPDAWADADRVTLDDAALRAP